MYNDQDLEFDDCHSTNTWNIFVQTDVQCTRMYIYQNIALMAMSFMCGSALYLILKEYFQYDFN